MVLQFSIYSRFTAETKATGAALFNSFRCWPLALREGSAWQVLCLTAETILFKPSGQSLWEELFQNKWLIAERPLYAATLGVGWGRAIKSIIKNILQIWTWSELTSCSCSRCWNAYESKGRMDHLKKKEWEKSHRCFELKEPISFLIETSSVC